ncbi:hypothetical protein SS1G_07538 [Sclerotinia sclerotiorum 1980 UF-70]|uniref:Protein transport protein SEC9 n=1 Tax=Sclerotinia sclerotiorum (strain ATCC 18683 / 1980 / Ss-1) TaxID=665079 RepID=A7EQD7_SCLS1|nr:hypothetical protein SS1G_07538 [Sclerotinia sclerotiorum 1980 UF-70]EDN91679.1 hypothetical protein SS1G_07538 [Sclerotinia sclerotiorum 1980 UF-70]
MGLFSRKDKNASPAPAANPYATPQPQADPYAQDSKYANMPAQPTQSPYQSARQQQYTAPGTGNAPDGPRGGMGGSNPRAPAPNGGGYGSDKYGSGGGYGANRYDGSSANSGSKYGPAGYGGLGRTNSNDTTTTEDNKNELFGGAKDRYAQKAAANSDRPPPYGAQSDSGPSTGGGYGAYGEERQLTAEEEEEEDVQATKAQIRAMKQEDVSSTRNALRIAAQAEETGRATLARLGAQGERIHNTEKNLDLAANHNRLAEEKAKELKTLNKTQRDEDIINKHRSERDQREETRNAAFASSQRMEANFRELQPGDVGYRATATKASLAERSKYQFEADSEDDEMENEIDSNLDALGHAAGRLNLLAKATGREVDDQNKHIERIIGKSDRVDDQIAMNRARLDRIH